MAPELRLEPLNCTTILVSWQPSPVNTANIQGYRLFYWEDSQQESMPIQLRAHDSHRTIGGLGRYCLKETARRLFSGYE